jgi:hypothetical protein
VLEVPTPAHNLPWPRFAFRSGFVSIGGLNQSSEALMPHTYEELKKKTVAELRDLAQNLQHEAVQGYTQMNKEHLLPALCQALGIDAHEHHAAVAAEKGAIKARMRAIKAACDDAQRAGDDRRLHQLRRQYHALNHSLRASAKRAMLH